MTECQDFAKLKLIVSKYQNIRNSSTASRGRKHHQLLSHHLMALNPPSKRKPSAPSTPHLSASASRKRVKTQDARTIAVQSSEAALSKTGELDVAAFVSAREFEIRALEAGITNSKGALATRAFQKVPRGLRRRTASHNVKRVPSRLRARAKREVSSTKFTLYFQGTLCI